jgi:hypothetical protein
LWNIHTEYADYLTFNGRISEAISEYQWIIDRHPPNKRYLEGRAKRLRMRLYKETVGEK